MIYICYFYLYPYTDTLFVTINTDISYQTNIECPCDICVKWKFTNYKKEQSTEKSKLAKQYVWQHEIWLQPGRMISFLLFQ